MSLVSDALKKAQREAAAREARDKGLAPPPEPRPPLHPFRRRRAPRAAALAAAAAGLIALAGVASFFLFRDSSAVGAARTAESPTPDVPISVKGETEPGVPGASRFDGSTTPSAAMPVMGEAGSDGSGAAREASEATPAPRVDLPPGAAPATPASPSAEAPAPAPPSRVPSQNERAAAAPPGPPSAPGATAGEQESLRGASSGEAPVPRRFVREAELAGGVRLRIGGIAYSEVAPLAYLNGRLIGVGESVEGWTVRAIGRGEVELGRGEERLILALR